MRGLSSRCNHFEQKNGGCTVGQLDDILAALFHLIRTLLGEDFVDSEGIFRDIDSFEIFGGNSAVETIFAIPFAPMAARISVPTFINTRLGLRFPSTIVG